MLVCVEVVSALEVSVQAQILNLLQSVMMSAVGIPPRPQQTGNETL